MGNFDFAILCFLPKFWFILIRKAVEKFAAIIRDAQKAAKKMIHVQTNVKQKKKRKKYPTEDSLTKNNIQLNPFNLLDFV